MTRIPLKLGPLHYPGFKLQRSGFRWLRDDGDRCQPGEVIAYCNVRLHPVERIPAGATPFADEWRDFQVAFAPRTAGVLRRIPQSSQGGWMDRLPFFLEWAEDFQLGYLEGPADADPDQTLMLLMVAGRRVSELAEDRSGLLTGWHDRKRAWWGEAPGPTGTLLSLGVCEQLGVMLGDDFAFKDFFQSSLGPAHVVFVPDHLQVPCARVVLEQIRRQPADVEAIAADLAQTLPACGSIPASSDWMFAGTLLSALTRSPLTENCDVLTRTGLQRVRAPDAVVLSLGAEAPLIMRHRRLGYSVNLHNFRIRGLGPAARAWFEAHFERVRRGPADIQRDFRELAAELRALSGTRMLVLNSMSTNNNEDIVHYDGFKAPLSGSLQTVRLKELNLMLHDLEHEVDLSIVDLDAIAADMGAAGHMPDNFHPDGAMQFEIRAEILRILRAQRIPGFAPRT